MNCWKSLPQEPFSAPFELCRGKRSFAVVWGMPVAIGSVFLCDCSSQEAKRDHRANLWQNPRELAFLHSAFPGRQSLGHGGCILHFFQFPLDKN